MRTLPDEHPMDFVDWATCPACGASGPAKDLDGPYCPNCGHHFVEEEEPEYRLPDCEACSDGTTAEYEVTLGLDFYGHEITEHLCDGHAAHYPAWIRRELDEVDFPVED